MLKSLAVAAVCLTQADATKDIVELAQSVPDLSTLVTAVVAGKLVKTLESAGPWTVFAPTNEAFAALPNTTLATILDPYNIKVLDALLTYHVLPEAVFSKDLKAYQTVKTVQGGELIVLNEGPKAITVNSATVTLADNAASNGVVHIIDGVLIPDGVLPEGCTAERCVFSYTNPRTGGVVQRCGEVDAAARMPADIFADPAAVEEYVTATIKYYALVNTEGTPGKLVQKGCNYQTYPVKGPCGKRCNVPWTTPELMKLTCDVKCGCKYPACPDVPDQPGKGFFCSLCGPTFNAPITPDYYYMSHTDYNSTLH